MDTPVSQPNEQPLPLSRFQRRYWLKWAQAPQSSSFNLALVFRITGELDRAALKQAAHLTLEKHPITHATFREDGWEQRYTDFGIDEFYSEVDGLEGQNIDTVLKRVLNKPFDLTSGPLYRFFVVHCNERTSYLVMGAHHAVADAHTGKLFAMDLGSTYNALIDPSGTAPLQTYSYADCISALRALQTAEQQEAARRFWKESLRDAPSTIDFPRRVDWVDGDYSADAIYFELGRDVAESLEEFYRQNRTTLFVVLSAIYGVALSKYANQRELLISYPVNLRPDGFSHVAGCFVNVVLQKVTIDSSTTFTSLVGDLTRQRSEVKDHVLYQLSSVIEGDIEKSYFTVFFGETNLNNTPVPLCGVTVEPLDMPWSEEFDRELRLVYDAADTAEIQFRLDFQRKKFDRDTIERFVDDYKLLAERLPGSEKPLYQIV